MSTHKLYLHETHLIVKYTDIQIWWGTDGLAMRLGHALTWIFFWVVSLLTSWHASYYYNYVCRPNVKYILYWMVKFLETKQILENDFRKVSYLNICGFESHVFWLPSSISFFILTLSIDKSFVLISISFLQSLITFMFGESWWRKFTNVRHQKVVFN